MEEKPSLRSPEGLVLALMQIGATDPYFELAYELACLGATEVEVLRFSESAEIPEPNRVRLFNTFRRVKQNGCYIGEYENVKFIKKHGKFVSPNFERVKRIRYFPQTKGG